jgi:glycine dehydrogenase
MLNNVSLRPWRSTLEGRRVGKARENKNEGHGTMTDRDEGHGMTTEHAGSGAALDFAARHVGPRANDARAMLKTVGAPSLEALVAEALPDGIAMERALELDAPCTEAEALAELRAMGSQNRPMRSYVGMGYNACVTPAVITRNVLESPRWYTPYTPYQAEISQGRLEALLVFQTMIEELTALPIAGASLLDEATAAAEAMAMAHGADRKGRKTFWVAEDCHPQAIAVVRTRAAARGIRVRVVPADAMETMDLAADGAFGVLVQYPATDGRLADPRGIIGRAHAAGAIVAMAADPLALALLTPPGELGADIAVGSTQRLGMPMGAGGPHAAYLATTEALKRLVPGRIVGVSVDAGGQRALRLALQTREQHIRREKASSNICTAQALPANVAAFYGVWHGPEGLTAIAKKIHVHAAALAAGLRALGHKVAGTGAGAETPAFFDALRVVLDPARGEAIAKAAVDRGVNLRRFENGDLGVALDETVGAADMAGLLAAFAEGKPIPNAVALVAEAESKAANSGNAIPAALARKSAFMRQRVFRAHRSETALARWLHRLASKDISLLDSMIPLGSCTLKLNPAAAMAPITWPEWGAPHPFAPLDQLGGYVKLVADLKRWLGEITGLPAVSLQPNSGAQGEYSGLLTIRAWHAANGGAGRDACLIPVSAHGTNPASAALAGLVVVPVACDAEGNIDLADLERLAALHAPRLAAIMITYPSTHGVFEAGVRRAAAIVHDCGGLVYLDGANMNALVGLARPGDLGADVCHLNLHKTFAIPHGGGGPGMGPICASTRLARHLPSHPAAPGEAGAAPCGTVAAAPWGSALVLTISWLYIRAMGAAGLARASQMAILAANYMAARLREHYPIVYLGQGGRCAHEFILDLRPFKKTAGVTADDVAKRLMDYGLHAPTMSWPVAGTLMIEPTESEPLEELDRFCEAMIQIRAEIRAIEEGRADAEDNPLKNAPCTAAMATADAWTHPYSRAEAAWPVAGLREFKYWPPVSRVDNAYGDRNLVCSCGA